MLQALVLSPTSLTGQEQSLEYHLQFARDGTLGALGRPNAGGGGAELTAIHSIGARSCVAIAASSWRGWTLANRSVFRLWPGLAQV